MVRLISALVFANIFFHTLMAFASPEPCVGGTCFPITLSDSMRLRGAALLRYWGFKVYSAAVYSAGDSPVAVDPATGLVPPNTETEFRLHYHRSFDSTDFQKSGREVIRKNPGYNEATMGPLLARVDELYRPVKEGDEYRLRFIPGKGIQFSLNDEILGLVPGDDFARVYLGIWLSPSFSLDASFTETLLSSSE